MMARDDSTAMAAMASQLRTSMEKMADRMPKADELVAQLQQVSRSFAEVMSVSSQAAAPPASVSAVIGWTAFEMGLHVSAIIGISREARLVRARAAIAWVATVGLGRSQTQIGMLLGNRHHTTIFSLLRKAEGLRGRDPAFAQLTTKLLDRIELTTGLRASGDAV